MPVAENRFSLSLELRRDLLPGHLPRGPAERLAHRLPHDVAGSVRHDLDLVVAVANNELRGGRLNLHRLVDRLVVLGDGHLLRQRMTCRIIESLLAQPLSTRSVPERSHRESPLDAVERLPVVLRLGVVPREVEKQRGTLEVQLVDVLGCDAMLLDQFPDGLDRLVIDASGWPRLQLEGVDRVVVGTRRGHDHVEVVMEIGLDDVARALEAGLGKQRGKHAVLDHREMEHSPPAPPLVPERRRRRHRDHEPGKSKSVVELLLAESEKRAGRQCDGGGNVSRPLPPIDGFGHQCHVEVAAQLVGRRNRGDHLFAACARVLADGEGRLCERRHDVVTRACFVEVGVERHLRVRCGGGHARDLRSVADK